MNILMLGTTDTKGGAAKVSWNLKKGLEKRGHHVSMIVGYKRSDEKTVREIFDTPLNNTISKFIGRNFRSRLHHHLAYHLSDDISLLPGKKIIRWTEFQKADLLHAHNLHSLFFNLKALPALSLHKPVVWTLHDMWAITGHEAHAFDNTNWITGGIKEKLPNTLPSLKSANTDRLWCLKKKIYQQSKLNLVVPSRWLLKKVQKSILQNQPITLIYNGVDASLFKPAEDKKTLRKKLNLPVNQKIILFASKGGSKNPWKGWEFAEKIIKQYEKKTNVIFVCLGGYEGNINHSNLISIDYLNDQQMLADYYAASDLLLYPSLADNCPLTVLEAMSSGLPVLTFHTGGIPELVEHNRSGYVAQYKNADDLLAGFDSLVSKNVGGTEKMSRAARQRVFENFTLEKMVDQYLTLYQSILGVRS